MSSSTCAKRCRSARVKRLANWCFVIGLRYPSQRSVSRRCGLLRASQAIILAVGVQAHQDRFEAGSLPDEQQALGLREPSCFPAACAAVIEAVGVDEQEAMSVADAGLPLAFPATLQRSLDERQRIPAPQPRPVKMNKEPLFLA